MSEPKAKLSKSEVRFEHPASMADHCGQCVHFERPHSCEIVAGRIDKEDWCDRFKKRRVARLYDNKKTQGEPT